MVGAWQRLDVVRIFGRATLIDFWRKHPDAETPLRLWFSLVEHAAWAGPVEVKARFSIADFIAGNRIVFNIKGNSYRLVVQAKYGPLFLVYIRVVGTHAEYDRIDATTI